LNFDLSGLKVSDTVCVGVSPFSRELCVDEDSVLEVVEPKGQRNHRSLAFQLLYAVDSLDYECDFEQLLTLYELHFTLKIARDSFAVQIVKGVVMTREELRARIEPLLENWGYERLDGGTRLLLHMAAWELLYCLEVPFKSVIDEYIELSKAFGVADSYKFVNGILDKIVP
jgi:N utilization substance protein B